MKYFSDHWVSCNGSCRSVGSVRFATFNFSDADRFFLFFWSIIFVWLFWFSQTILWSNIMSHLSVKMNTFSRIIRNYFQLHNFSDLILSSFITCSFKKRLGISKSEFLKSVTFWFILFKFNLLGSSHFNAGTGGGRKLLGVWKLHQLRSRGVKSRGLPRSGYENLLNYSSKKLQSAKTGRQFLRGIKLFRPNVSYATFRTCFVMYIYQKIVLINNTCLLIF